MRGSVYQRESDGKWVGVAELPKGPDGKRRRKTVYGKTEREATQKLNKILYEIQIGDYVEPTKDTLVAFLKDYHKIRSGCNMWKPNYKIPDDAKWEENTALLNKMYIDVHFEPYFKDAKLVDIKPTTLDKFYNYKLSTPGTYEIKAKNKVIKKERPPLSMNTVIKLDKFLKSAYYYAVKNGLAKTNPTNSVVVLGPKKKYKPTVYNEDQFIKLLNSVEGTDDEIPILLGGGCGLRRGEIFGLTWNNISFSKKTITIQKTTVRFKETKDKEGAKNETSERTIYAPPYVIEVLDKYKKKIEPKSTDKVITKWKPGSYSDRFGKLLDKFGLPHCRLHDLRHYNAVIMMNKGIPDKVAAEYLGHSDTTMLHAVYQHVQEEMKLKTSESLNEMFEKKNSHEPLEE